MIWGLILLMIYKLKKHKADHQVLDGENDSRRNIVYQEYLNAF